MASEEERAFALQEIRRGEPQKEDTASKDRQAPAGPRINPVEGGMMMAFAMLNDGLDYLIVGSIPLVGDLLDGITWFTISMWVWVRGLKRPPLFLGLGAIELIPFGDLIPTYTLMVIGIIIYNNPRFGKLRKFAHA
ncbi:hypothetical protein IIA95_00045 [Patescibacteria group bacterium]|nr:hypothetical protein [Patescibacteria group bacterium]